MFRYSFHIWKYNDLYETLYSSIFFTGVFEYNCELGGKENITYQERKHLLN